MSAHCMSSPILRTWLAGTPPSRSSSQHEGRFATCGHGTPTRDGSSNSHMRRRHPPLSKICNSQLLVDISMGSLLFLLLSPCFWDADARFHQHIWVDNGVRRGDYSKLEMCPRGHAHGFSLKIHAYQGSLLWQDDTSLNGIRLYCSDGTILQSNVGRHGDWSLQQYCSGGNLNAFRLRVNPLRGWGMAYDDTAVSNVEFKCETGEILTGYGHEWGTFGVWSICSSSSICGLQTWVQDPKGVTDEIALNNVIFLCCAYDR